MKAKTNTEIVLISYAQKQISMWGAGVKRARFYKLNARNSTRINHIMFENGKFRTSFNEQSLMFQKRAFPTTLPAPKKNFKVADADGKVTEWATESQACLYARTLDYATVLVMGVPTVSYYKGRIDSNVRKVKA